MKRILSLLITLTLLVSTALVVPVCAEETTTVDYTEDVRIISELGLLDAFTTDPEATLTRAKVAEIAVKAMGLSVNGGVNTKFSDVKADIKSSAYIDIAASMGIVSGFSDGRFMPNEPATYNQLEPCPIGESYSVTYPDVEFFSCIGSDIEERTIITPENDVVIEVMYDCEGIMGASAIGESVTELEAGASYLIYNAKDETSRSGFLSVGAVGEGITTTNGIADAGPAFIWHFEGDENKFTVRNSYGVYIPQLSRGSLVRGSDTPEQFIFTLNSDGKTWS
ncbi:MAG: S-layer homology domain-containing protein, partial [Oscillospiraceae bacterium]|nr:S-layer homology domain-containing protein [Oscillospiraceae bacterium]